MKKFLSTLFLSFICFTSFFKSIYAHQGQLIALVNDRPVSRTDLNARIKMAILSSNMANDSETHTYLKPQILKLMIDEELQLCLCEKFKIDINDAEIAQAIDTIEYRNGMQKGQLKRLFKENQIEFSIMNKHIKASIAFREYIKERYEAFVQITDEDINRYIQQLEISKQDNQYMLAEIVLDFDSAKSETDVQKNAHEMVERMRRGARFSALAQEFSSSSSAVKGGDIGWISISRLDPILQQAVRKTKVGEISHPIKTKNGYHIIFVRDQRSAGESVDKDTLLTFNQVLFPVSPQASQSELAAIFTRAKRLGDAARNCTMLKTLTKSVPNVQIQEVKKSSVRELPPELRDLLLNSGIDQASRPVLADIGMLTFMVCEKEEFNPQTPTRDEVRSLLTDRKLSALAQQELRTIRRKASIFMYE